MSQHQRNPDDAAKDETRMSTQNDGGGAASRAACGGGGDGDGEALPTELCAEQQRAPDQGSDAAACGPDARLPDKVVCEGVG